MWTGGNEGSYTSRDFEIPRDWGWGGRTVLDLGMMRMGRRNVIGKYFVHC